MSEVDINYELKVLKMMLNLYLDKTVSVTEEGLKSLEANRDQVVWELATKIYSQSGYKVEFCTARDVVNSRIGVMKLQLAQARQAAIEANRIAKEEADRAAEEKARRAAEEESRRIARVEAYRVTEEKTRRAAEEEARRIAREKADRAAEEMTRILGELAGDEGFVRVFVKVRKIVTDQLSVEENNVNLDSHLSNDLGADELDLVELVVALEEEFDIEINEEEASDRLNLSCYPSSWLPLSSGSSGSNSIITACEVKQVVDFISEKLSL